MVEKLSLTALLLLAAIGWGTLLGKSFDTEPQCPTVPGEKLYQIHETKDGGVQCIYSTEVTYGTKLKKRKAA